MRQTAVLRTVDISRAAVVGHRHRVVAVVRVAVVAALAAVDE